MPARVVLAAAEKHPSNYHSTRNRLMSHQGRRLLPETWDQQLPGRPPMTVEDPLLTLAKEEGGRGAIISAFHIFMIFYDIC